MPTVHPSSIVGPDVQLGEGVEIGPFCSITGQVTLGDHVRLISHVCVQGPCSIGARTILYPNSAIGMEPQDFKFAPGSPTAGVKIGSDCLIREHATVHAATKQDRPTTVGARVFLMVGSHLGHDASVGDHAILVNNVLLAGHTEVHAQAILSGGVMVHQFARVGRLVMASGGALLTSDVPPFCLAAHRNTLVGLNLVGMRRSGMPREEIDAVRRAFREVLAPNPQRGEMIEMLAERGQTSPAVREMHDFIAGTKRRSLTPVIGSRARDRRHEPERAEL